LSITFNSEHAVVSDTTNSNINPKLRIVFRPSNRKEADVIELLEGKYKLERADTLNVDAFKLVEKKKGKVCGRVCKGGMGWKPLGHHGSVGDAIDRIVEDAMADALLSPEETQELIDFQRNVVGMVRTIRKEVDNHAEALEANLQRDIEKQKKGKRESKRRS